VPQIICIRMPDISPLKIGPESVFEFLPTPN